MKHRLTNRATHWRGSTTSVTVRLPDPVVEFIDSHFDEGIKNRSEFLQHWAQIGTLVSQNPEIDEALEWALRQDEEARYPQFTVTLADYGSVTVGNGDGPVVHYEPPTMADAVLDDPPNELTAIREAQLEALRSRVK